MIPRDALAAEPDGQVMLRTITGARREDTFPACADSFHRDKQAVGTLTRLPQSE